MQAKQQSLKPKGYFEIDDDYQVRSRIANSNAMMALEGYPAIRHEIYEASYLEPDESEYCLALDYEYDEFGEMIDLKESTRVNEGYAYCRRKKYPFGYDG